MWHAKLAGLRAPLIDSKEKNNNQKAHQKGDKKPRGSRSTHKKAHVSGVGCLTACEVAHVVACMLAKQEHEQRAPLCVCSTACPLAALCGVCRATTVCVRLCA